MVSRPETLVTGPARARCQTFLAAVTIAVPAPATSAIDGGLATRRPMRNPATSATGSGRVLSRPWPSQSVRWLPAIVRAAVHGPMMALLSP